MFTSKPTHVRGFTLIELLVVISIIGMLSSVVLVSLGSARAKARDSKRIQAIVQLRTALELYRSANGTYPTYSGGAYDDGSNEGGPVTATADCVDNGGGAEILSVNQLIPGLIPNFISTMPITDTAKCMVYASDGKDYKLFVMEVMENPLSVNSLFYDANIDISGYNSTTISISSGGARTWNPTAFMH